MLPSDFRGGRPQRRRNRQASLMRTPPALEALGKSSACRLESRPLLCRSSSVLRPLLGLGPTLPTTAGHCHAGLPKAHEHCIESVLEIRRFLTATISDLPDKSDLLGSLRVMRAACRKFLDSMQQHSGRRIHLDGGMKSFSFHSALGEVRGALGPQIAVLATHYRIDVEGELAKVLPFEDSE